MIQLKRVYEAPSSTDGTSFSSRALMASRGEKILAEISAWQKEAGPSNELRKWFHHDPARWTEFRRRYFVELKENQTPGSPSLQRFAAARSP